MFKMDFFLSGDSPSWVEKYAPRCELEIVRRFIVEDLAFMDQVTIEGVVVEVFDMVIVHLLFLILCYS